MREDSLKIQRQLRYYLLRLLALRDEPHELALGIAFGVLAGMMPIIPFQTALALALAVAFKASKITSVLGTWVSNPLNWYFLYFYSYKLGAFLLLLPEKNATFSSIMEAVRSGSEIIVIAEKLMSAGGLILAAFILGGLIMGIAASIPSYFICIHLFRYAKAWRKKRKERRKWRLQGQ